MNEKDYDEQLTKAANFHGHVCGGIAIGTKLANSMALNYLDWN